MRCSLALLVCALVGAVLLHQAEGAALRSLIQQQMEGRLRSNAQQLLGVRGKKNKCKPEAKKTESRTCEPPDDTAPSVTGQRCNECVQQCHAFGDPHLKTFDNECTTKVFDKKGTWKFFEAPGLTFEVLTDKRYKKKTHIFTAYVNGEEVLDASECGTKENPSGKVATDEMWLHSDEAKNNGDEADIKVKYYAGCRFRGEIISLEVLVTVADKGQGKSPDTWERSDTSSDMLNFWATARGACLDWIGDGGANAVSVESTEWDCSKTSHLASLSGRKCTCTAECAAYGDPHVLSFDRKVSNSVSDAFLMPKAKTWNEWESIMFTAEQMFAVNIAVDECEFVSEATIYMMKPETFKKFTACDANRPTAADLTIDDYEIIRVTAEEVCADHESSEDRKTIMIPSPNDEKYGAAYYDSSVEGYNMGRQALFSKDNGDELILLDGSRDTEPTPMNECLNELGFTKESNLEKMEEVKLGGASVTLKCHLRLDNVLYFNICVDRRGLTTEITGDEAWDQSAKDDLFSKVEAAGKTGGWCATGDLAKGSSAQASTMQLSSFENRASGETTGFVLLEGGTPSS